MTTAPSKPKPSTASTEVLLDHYHSQLDEYNRLVEEQLAGEPKRMAEMLMRPARVTSVDLDREGLSVTGSGIDLITRTELIDRIRRQNHRLGRIIKNRAHELLLTKLFEEDGVTLKKKDGKYTVAMTYQDILAVLRREFPEGSTSEACLRWYVVKMKERARDEGSAWPDLPNVRPRSKAPVPATTAQGD